MRGNVRIKVAIWAFFQAVGPVNVNSKHDDYASARSCSVRAVCVCSKAVRKRLSKEGTSIGPRSPVPWISTRAPLCVNTKLQSASADESSV